MTDETNTIPIEKLEALIKVYENLREKKDNKILKDTVAALIGLSRISKKECNIMTDKSNNNLIVETFNNETSFHDKSTTTLEFCARKLELYAMFAEATWLRDVAVEIKQKDEEIENLKKQLQEKVFSCKYLEEKNKSLLTK